MIGPDLAQRLAAAGVPTPLAERTARLHERLVAARFGGELHEEGPAEARELVAELERAFSS